MTLFECFQTLPSGTCEGRNGTSCCVGFKWDLTQDKCIPCDKGYRGNNCEEKCPFPSYGVDCQMKCNCIDKGCDPANGCNYPSTEYPITSVIGLEVKIVTTKPLNYEASISETCGKGFRGNSCEEKCPFPSYGVDCQMKCNCIDKDCDPAYGCKNSSTEYPITLLIGLEFKIVTTDLLNYEASISENFSKVKPNNDTTTCMAVKQESKQTNYLKVALIGLAVVSIIITCIYFNMRLLEKRIMITRIV
uniref:EGF-like domain-containing protein n=1 Tax=Magallana gigas TaxID=29159 RepID=A0A8W8M4T1_MAGGI